MAIRPISSVSFNTNNISFGRKKEGRDENHHRHSSAPLKTVPLAVMLAMSPLNNVEAQSVSSGREIVSATTYEKVLVKNDLPVALKFLFVNSDSDNATIESIQANSQDISTLMGGNAVIENATVVSVNNYSIGLVGADGNKVGTIRHSQLELRGLPNSEGRRKYYPIANPQIVSDFNAFARSDRNNNAIEIREINNTLYARHGKMPSSYETLDTSWMRKTMQNNYNFGTLVKQMDLSTEIGEYNIKYYSSDSNNSDIETIVCERNDGVRFKIDGLRVLNMNIVAENNYKADPLSYGCLDISWPNVGKFTIFDNELFMSLANLGQYSNFAKAVNLSEANYNIMINSDGSILKANQ